MRNGGCNHICKNSIGSYQCDCKNRFYLSSDGKTCEGILFPFHYECDLPN